MSKEIKPSWTLKQIRERVELFAMESEEEQEEEAQEQKQVRLPVDFTDRVLKRVHFDQAPHYQGVEVETHPFARLAERPPPKDKPTSGP